MRASGDQMATRERLLWALTFAVFGPALLLLRGRRFDGTTPWWAYVLVGLASACFAYLAAPWALRNRG